MGRSAGMNKFGYAAASPFRFTDRRGLEVSVTGGYKYDPPAVPTPTPPSGASCPIASSGGGPDGSLAGGGAGFGGGDANITGSTGTTADAGQTQVAANDGTPGNNQAQNKQMDDVV